MNIDVQVIEDSISPNYIRLTTLVLTLPKRYFETVVCHRELSCSSHWQYEATDDDMSGDRTVVLTSTMWQTVIDRLLRYPHTCIQTIGQKLHEAVSASKPVALQHGRWHLPFVDEEDYTRAIKCVQKDFHTLVGAGINPVDHAVTLLQHVAVSRLLSEPYRTSCSSEGSFNHHVQQFSRIANNNANAVLVGTEHLATPDYTSESAWLNPNLHGNLTGWCQYRQIYQRELQHERGIGK